MTQLGLALFPRCAGKVVEAERQTNQLLASAFCLRWHPHLGMTRPELHAGVPDLSDVAQFQHDGFVYGA